LTKNSLIGVSPGELSYIGDIDLSRLNMSISEEQQQEAQENNNNAHINILDEQWYYYQTKAGTVSRSPHSLRQLVRLFCPVREGLDPILASSTQCLPVVAQQGQQELSYGEWKIASQIDIIREACCTTWFWTTKGQLAKGPGSCRKFLELILSKDDLENSNLLVFAKDITPEWTKISKLNSLILALEALQNNNNGSGKEDSPENNSMVIGAESNIGQQSIKQELDAFLSSADSNRDVTLKKVSKHVNDDDDHAYESDGGTRYVKDPLTGRWIHEALAPPEALSMFKQSAMTNSGSKQGDPMAADSSVENKLFKKKSKKAKFAKRNAKQWIYVSGLPTEGVTTEDLQQYLSRAGLIDLDPETLQPKIKLYKNHSTEKLNGDASVCYANKQSVDLALQVLDDSLWDKDHRIKIERAQFQAKSVVAGKDITSGANEDGENKFLNKKRPISEAQRKVKRLAILQAQDEGFGGRLTGGRKGLCIIVIKGLTDGIPEDKIEDVLHETCQEFGPIGKITCISKTRVVIIKFVEPIAASAALKAINGSPNPRTKQKMEAIYWDGVTDYTKMEGGDQKEQEDEERRHEEFGDWLESQEELPLELQLQIAND